MKSPNSMMLVSALALLGLAHAETDVQAIGTTTTTTGIATANVTTTSTEAAPMKICTQPDNAVPGWWVDSWHDEPHWCTKKAEPSEWSMLRAYRLGGQEGLHWTYVDGGDQSRCLTNWGLYSGDGHTLLATVDRATYYNDHRLWCALPVYRPGGIPGKQWSFCECESRTPPPTMWR